jgi:Ulp1 family protease
MLETFRDNAIVQEKVLFLSSHFYSRLRAGKGSSARARMEAGYKNVSTWLARSNFFNRSIIFIPINKEYVGRRLGSLELLCAY